MMKPEQNPMAKRIPKSPVALYPTALLLGEWESQVTPHIKVEIREEWHHILIDLSTWEDSRVKKLETYPLHYDAKEDLYYFYRDGKFTEMLFYKDSDELHLFPSCIFIRVENSYDEYSKHLFKSQNSENETDE